MRDVMPILRADVKELAGNQHADIEQLMPLLPGALSGAKAASTMKRYTPAWGYFRKLCAEHDLPFLPAAPPTVALYLLSLTQTAKSFVMVKLASAPIHSFSRASHRSPRSPEPLLWLPSESMPGVRNLHAGDNRKEPITGKE